MLAIDQAGNKLLEFIDISEEKASLVSCTFLSHGGVMRR